MRVVLFALLLGIVGLVIGYFLFANYIGDKYVSVERLLRSSNNFIEKIEDSVLNLARIKRNILISGAAGAGLGLLLGLIARRRR